MTLKTRRIGLFCVLALIVGALTSGCGLIDIILARPIRARLDRACDAAPFEVTKHEDTYDALCTQEDCSLREAVFTANACEGEQEIQLGSGAYQLTRRDLGDYEDPNAASTLVFTEGATVVGDGSIIDGLEEVRLFDIDAGDDTVVLDNLTIQDGHDDIRGGAIYVPSGTLELRNSVVRNSTAGAEGVPGAGGGIFLSRGSVLAMINSEVSGNRAYGQGGGIFSSSGSELTVDEDSTVVFNEALEGYSGGGIYSRGNSVVSGQIVRNRTTWAGGGVANAGVMTILDAEIRDNIATDGVGGGISNTGTVRVQNTDVLSNTAQRGAGLFAYRNPRWAVDLQTYLTDVRFEGNEADQDGGALFNSGDALLVGTRIIAESNSGRNGAGLYNAGEAYLFNSNLADNQADRNGGGLMNGPLASLTGSGLTLEGNSGRRGGGLYNHGSAVLKQAAIRDNSASSVEGGGIWTAGIFSLKESTVSGNQSPGTDGVFLGASALWVDRDVSLSILNATISGNELTSGAGAAVFNRGGVVDIEHATITDNNSPALSGLSGTVPDIRLADSIVVGNGIDVTCTRAITSEGFNLFDNPDCGPRRSMGDILISSASEAGLLPLANYGGPTRTHGLAAGSPALDAVTAGCPGPTNDQRGEPRPDGDACDIGSFEGTAEAETRSAEIDINFNADLYTIERGECTTLRWKVTGADTITLLGLEREATEAQQVCPDQTTGYTLTAENETSEESAFLQIEVTKPSDDSGPQTGCFVGYDQNQQPICQVPCPGDPQQYGGVCYQ